MTTAPAPDPRQAAPRRPHLLAAAPSSPAASSSSSSPPSRSSSSPRASRPSSPTRPSSRARPTASGPTSARSSSAPSGPPSSRCSWRVPIAHRHRALHLALRTAPRSRRASATSSTCSPPCRRSSSASGASRCSPPPSSPLYDWLVDEPRLVPALRRPGLGHRPHHPHRRHRARGHDPPDHHRPVAARSSCRRPRLHEEAALALGATRWEMIRMAVLPFGRPGIISAAMLGLGRALGETMAVAMVLSPRRDHHLRPDQLAEPVDDRREHRAQLPRGARRRRQRAHRDRPHPVRHHLRGQLDRPRRRQPPQGLLGSQLMTDHRHRHGANTLTTGSLPQGAPRGRLLAGWAVAGRRVRRLHAVGGAGDFNWIGAARPRHRALRRRHLRRSRSSSRAPRQATDRLVTVARQRRRSSSRSSRWSRCSSPCSSNGSPASTCTFFTSSMRNVVGEGGGALHAIVGTLADHRHRRASSRCRSAC